MFESSPDIAHELTTERGECRVRLPAPGVLHTWVRGHMCARVARVIVDAGNTLMDRHGPMLAFHEWDMVETYDSDARKVLTDWGYDRRASVRKAHIVSRSRLVAMGVSVASVVLGDMLQSHADPATFRLALREAMRAPATPPRAPRAVNA